MNLEERMSINRRFQDLYDEGMAIGKHGHYETMFGAMHQAYGEFLIARTLSALIPQHELKSAENEKWPKT